MGDLRHMAQIRSAATSEDVEPGHFLADRVVLAPEFHGIAIVKRLGLVEFRMALARGVATDTADAARPAACHGFDKRLGRLPRRLDRRVHTKASTLR